MDYESFKTIKEQLHKEIIFEALEYVEQAVKVAKGGITTALKLGKTQIELKDDILIYSIPKALRTKWNEYDDGLTNYVSFKINHKITMWLHSLGYECSIWYCCECIEKKEPVLKIIIHSFHDLVNEFEKKQISEDSKDSAKKVSANESLDAFVNFEEIQ
jgi:hypothetical protein